MSYVKNVGKGSVEFDSLVRIIIEVRDKTSIRSTSGIKEKIKEIYGITIGDFDRSKSYTSVDFGDEKNYMMFLLTWY